MPKLKLLDSWIAGVPAAAIVIAVAVAVVGICHGCADHKTPTVAIVDSEPPAPAMEPTVLDFDYCLDDGTCYAGIVYDRTSEIGINKIYLTFNDKWIQPVATMLDAFGYEFAPNRSKYIISSTLDGDPVAIVLLAFTGPVTSPADDNLAILKYSEIRGIGLTLQLELMYAGSVPDWFAGGIVDVLGVDQAGRMQWVQSFEPDRKIYVHKPAQAPVLDPPVGDPNEWDWWTWIKCTGQSALIECAVSLPWCIMAEDWNECAEEECEESFFASAIRCACKQIW